MDNIEKFEDDVVMQVAVIGSASSVWILRGENASVAPKLSIGAPDTDPLLIAYLVNDRKKDGPYTSVERVHSGMLMGASTLHGKGDQSYSRGGWSVGTGNVDHKDMATEPGEAEEPTSSLEKPVQAWLIHQNGRKYIFVCEIGPNSEEIVLALQHVMAKGSFGIKPLLAGQVTLDPTLFAPGWATILETKPPEQTSTFTKH